MRWVTRDPIGYEGGVNLFEYVLSNPIKYSDPTGEDIWIEGSSGDEPYPHWSIHVGDPNGHNEGFSFAFNNGGTKYQDFENRGKILRYIKTTPFQDLLFMEALMRDIQIQDRIYFWNGSCLDYSEEWFEAGKKFFQKVETRAPRRTNPPRTGFQGRFTYYLSSSSSSSSR